MMEAEMSEELKSCPFCGAKAEFSDLSYLTGKPSWCISCTSSKCFAPHTDTCSKKEAVERWNNRPAEEALQKQIAELEAERDHFREVAKKLVWLYSDEHQERLDNGLRIDGFYSHEWLGMILNMAREALEGAGE